MSERYGSLSLFWAMMYSIYIAMLSIFLPFLFLSLSFPSFTLLPSLYFSDFSYYPPSIFPISPITLPLFSPFLPLSHKLSISPCFYPFLSLLVSLPVSFFHSHYLSLWYIDTGTAVICGTAVILGYYGVIMWLL